MVSRETSIRDGLEMLGLLNVIPADAPERLARFVALLETVAIPRGYLGPAEGPKLLTRHVLESAAIFPIVAAQMREGQSSQMTGPPPHVSSGTGSGREDRGPTESLPPGEAVEASAGLIDVGSGAGLPGIVLACLGMTPLTLLEAQARRAAFLREATASLGLRCEVVCARAEAVGQGDLRESFSVATARALASLPVVLELTLPLVGRGGGVIVVSDAQSRQEQRGAKGAARELGGADPERRGFEVPGTAERRWVMIVRKTQRTPRAFPRRAGVPQRRPLGADVE